MLTFQNIIGQQSIKTHFENAISTGKVSHAYILSGEEGMGKMDSGRGICPVSFM